MKQSIFKSIAGGVLLGAFVFFTGPLLPVILILKFIFTPFGMGRARGRFSMSGPGFTGMEGGSRLGFTDKIRSMSDEDYAAFKSKYEDKFKRSC